MSDYNYGWQRIATLAAAEELRHSKDCRVFDRSQWTGPATYRVTTKQVRCPRNCCYDTVLILESAEDRAAALRQQIRELAQELVEVRARIPREKT